MSRRKLTLIIFGILLLALVGPFVALTRDTSEPEQKVNELDLASVAAKKFLETHVNADGVVGDIAQLSFSEQAQGMLVAAATADKARFDKIYAMSGAVPQGPWVSSADVPARLTMIRAQLVAAERLNDPSYLDAAKTSAVNLLELNAATSPPANGPITLDLTYAGALQPRTFQELYELTGDERWKNLATSARATITKQLNGDQKLPADSASADSPAPDAKYGAQAQTVPLWLKDSCDPADKATDKKLWLALRNSPTARVAKTLELGGKVDDGAPSALAAVATAATAEVAGERVQSLQLLDQADAIAREQGTPDAAAWAAIGRIVVSTDWLGPC